MATILIILTLLVGPPTLYLLYVAWTAIRLAAFARRLRRDCAPRGWRLEWRFGLFFPDDWEDPILLRVDLHRGGRQFSFVAFRSLLEHWGSRGTLRPLALSERLGGRVFLDRKDGRGTTADLIVRDGRAEFIEIGRADIDADYTLCRDKHGVSGEGLALLRAALGRTEVREQLDACGGRLKLSGGELSLERGQRDGDVLDWIDRAAQLAELLDEALKKEGPYR